VQIADEKPRDLRGPRAGLRGDLDIEAEIPIERVGRIDDRARLVILEPLKVARREAFADAAEPVGPCAAIDDPVVAAGGEVERAALTARLSLTTVAGFTRSAMRPSRHAPRSRA
jgi:hypothetical protein